MVTKPIDLAAFVADLEAIGWRVYDRTDIPEVMLRLDHSDGNMHWWSKIHATPMSISGSDFIDSKVLDGAVQQMSVSLEAPHWLAAQAIIRRHVSPVPDPAPTVGLLAAAQAYFANRDRADSLFSTGLWIGKGDVSKEMLACNERAMDAMDALRRAVEDAPESAPIALTDDEKRQVANRAITLTFRGYGPEKTSIDWCREIVDAFLSDLDELGFELRGRV